ncbi:LysR family transcriptional regulator [Kitasatospora sp. NBC_00240]|uniref:LysR family transcriptional regulator n=1 Tax=Kitasatospora sp. NBC_00240 TaxID=2903567 RepID=UPI002257F011|nr:LysR family transcriptional regulator [Kitasatospora sp. NBC_00240]MCX5211179.1 LysR family transcriptional regulator [Kitasatospora sp. NBC_00240]
MDIDARTLRTFCAVVRSGSFTAAARRLGYSQSSVTAQMRALEKQVGEPVFERLPAGVRLTPAGATLRGYAQQLLGLVGEMEEALRGPAATAPRLTLGLAPTLVQAELLARTAHFARLLLPGRRIGLRTVGSREIPAALRAGTLDAALLLSGKNGVNGVNGMSGMNGMPGMNEVNGATVAPGDGDGRPARGDLSATVLQELEFAAVTGAGPHRPAGLRPGPPESLGRPGQPGRPGRPEGRGRPQRAGRAAAWTPDRTVVTDLDCPSQRWLPEYLRLRYGVTPECLEAASADGAGAGVRAGLGCAMLPTGPAVAGDGDGYRGGLLRVPGVPRMRWSVVLASGRAGGLREGPREALAEALRLALADTLGSQAGAAAPAGAA